MRLYPVLLLIVTTPLQAQIVHGAGLGYGSQSSYQHPTFVVADLDFNAGRGWLLAPAARMSSYAGLTGWRVQLTLQRRLGAGAVRPYVGVGPSWTNERNSWQWNGGSLGAVGLVGLEARAVSIGVSGIWLYAQADGYTHSYATGQAHLGLRFQP